MATRDEVVGEKRPLLSGRPAERTVNDPNSAGLQDNNEDDVELSGCGATAACDPHRALHRFLVLILICFLSFGE